jgi:hypothetical protein
MAVAGDTISFATTSLLSAAITSGTTAALTGVDVITGFKAGDTISLFAAANTVTGTLGTTVAAAVDATASLVRGSFDAATTIFTSSSTGTDTLFVYDANGTTVGTAVEAVVLVGFVGSGTAFTGIVGLGG